MPGDYHVPREAREDVEDFVEWECIRWKGHRVSFIAAALAVPDGGGAGSTLALCRTVAMLGVRVLVMSVRDGLGESSNPSRHWATHSLRPSVKLHSDGRAGISRAREVGRPVGAWGRALPEPLLPHGARLGARELGLAICFQGRHVAGGRHGKVEDRPPVSRPTS